MQHYTRASRGSSKPCPGCGEQKYHKTGEVCLDCHAHIRKGREALERERQDHTREVFFVPTRYNAHKFFPMPTAGAYVVLDERHLSRSAKQDALALAILDLIERVGEQPLDWHGRSFDRRVFASPDHYGVNYESGSGNSYIRLEPAVAAAFDALLAAARAALNSEYQSGVHDGSHLLSALADGTITVTELNQRTAERNR